ncbi:MAG: phenylalanine--tRNA ligase beta subunit-related protein, partial [Patescibacteria group bacterium]
MKVPLNWLKEYVDIPADVSVVSDLFTAIGHMQDHQPEVVVGDTVLDLEVRQNRSDCLSILGLALELSAVSEKPLRVPRAYESEMPKAPLKSTIDIKDEDLCYRFNTVTIEGISVKESPEWLKNRLEAYGIKPINNVVDITNYVMVEIGEPLHAFDLGVLQKPVLIIRRAVKGEKLAALNGKVLNLTSEDLIVSTEKEPVALAGIIGGTKSSITSKTTRILLEAATYNQAGIRRTSLRHSLRTEASLRHEKFLHPYLAEQGLKRAIEMILEICGGILGDHTDCFTKKNEETKVTMRMSRLEYLCGVHVPFDTVVGILSRLGFD